MQSFAGEGAAMITIGKIAVEHRDRRSRLTAAVHVPQDAICAWQQRAVKNDAQMKERYRTEFLDAESRFQMWFEVEDTYADALCPERSDAFLAAILPFAMISSEDIRCEVPVTDRLLYQVRAYLIPSLCDEAKGYRQIAVEAESAPEAEKIAASVGTGISCGVDSFAAVQLHLREDVPAPFRLTHLALFNTGALNFAGYAKDKPLSQWREETSREFGERIALGKTVARELHLDFISVDSNVPDLYQGYFLYSHTYRNLSAVLATQKMWANYYYASGGRGNVNDPALDEVCAAYDPLNLSVLSTGSLCFYSAGAPYSRLQKTEMIADDPVAQKYLNVCSFHTVNCGRCDKCIHTIAALDLLGKLDTFKACFPNLSYYESNKWKIMANIAEARENDLYLYEMKQYMERHGVRLSAKAKRYHHLLPLRKLRRAFRKARKENG